MYKDALASQRSTEADCLFTLHVRVITHNTHRRPRYTLLSTTTECTCTLLQQEGRSTRY